MSELMNLYRGVEWAFEPTVMLIMATLSATSAAVGAALGALAGLGTPRFLDRVRGRWPLPAIAITATGVGAAVGAGAASSWFALLQAVAGSAAANVEMLPWLAGTGALFGAVAATVWWTPFTIATVLGRGWPVTKVVAMATPAVALAVLKVIALLAAL
jgi:hypothetical protein